MKKRHSPKHLLSKLPVRNPPPINAARLTRNFLFFLYRMGIPLTGLLALIVTGGAAIAFLDGMPLNDGVYLALITALTVGYGDFTPESPASKIIAVAVGFFGLVATGLVVAAAVRAVEFTYDQLHSVNSTRSQPPD